MCQVRAYNPSTQDAEAGELWVCEFEANLDYIESPRDIAWLARGSIVKLTDDTILSRHQFCSIARLSLYTYIFYIYTYMYAFIWQPMELPI
jgi:hypothetical protein